MKRTFCLLTAIIMIVACLAATGCGKKEEASTVIKIGGTGPLTGGAAIYGTAAKNGATIAVEEINKLGGLQFELKYEDDTHDTEKAVNAYNTLKDWGMQISLGSVTSSPCVATAAEHQKDTIFGLTPSASSTDVLKDNDMIFQMCFADPNQGSASAQYIFDKALASKVGIIWKNDDVYSKGIYETFVKKAAELGLEIVSDTTFTSDSQSDFSVQLTKAQENEAELLFLPMYYDAASLILAQADAMGYKPAFFGVDGMDGILTLENFDTKLAEGVMLLTPFSADASDEKTKNFVAKYQEAYKDIPNQFAADAYDCVYAIYQACNNAKVTPSMSAKDTATKMIEQFTSMSFDGLTGNGMSWDKDGAVTKAPKGMIIKDGAYVGMD